MNNENQLREINRLNFEDFIWLIFIILGLMNIFGDYNEKEYLKSNNRMYENYANEIFELTLIITLFIYFYFF